MKRSFRTTATLFAVTLFIIIAMASAHAKATNCSKSNVPDLGKTTAEVHADPALGFVVASVLLRDANDLPLCNATVTVRGVEKAWFRSSKPVNGDGQATFIIDPSASPDGPYVFAEVRLSSTETMDLEIPVVQDGHTHTLAFSTVVAFSTLTSGQ